MPSGPPPMKLYLCKPLPSDNSNKAPKKLLNDEIFFHFMATLMGQKLASAPDEVFIPFRIQNLKRKA
jgi:hypothetical protein